MDIYLTETNLGRGRVLYYVWIDGVVYDTFHSRGWLTFTQQVDVAAGYREALATDVLPLAG